MTQNSMLQVSDVAFSGFMLTLLYVKVH